MKQVVASTLTRMFQEKEQQQLDETFRAEKRNQAYRELADQQLTMIIRSLRSYSRVSVSNFSQRNVDDNAQAMLFDKHRSGSTTIQDDSELVQAKNEFVKMLQINDLTMISETNDEHLEADHLGNDRLSLPLGRSKREFTERNTNKRANSLFQ